MFLLKNVSKSYREGGVSVPVLEQVQFSMQKGEQVAIVGPSGSGKSTLLNILGLLDTPSSGEYLFNGELVHKLSGGRQADFRNRKIGFVFQAFMLQPRLTVWENVELPLLYSSFKRKERKARVLETLEQVGMADIKHQLAAKLSGGQKQRVAIARALVNRPELILADEPTGNLDQRSKEQILEIFTMLHSQGKTIVLVTHDIEVTQIAERVLTMQDGRLCELPAESRTVSAARLAGVLT